MRDVRDALEALKDIVGAPTLEFDGVGRAELIIEDQISLYIFRISDHELELTAYTTATDRYVSVEQLQALLRLNSIDKGLRAARFALDARGVPFLCQRVDVQLVDREALDRLVLDFVKTVMTFRDVDLTIAKDPGSPVRADDLSKDGEGGPLIRV
ncbi:type III secretion system chaperone [Rhizobium alvei]|uniref:Type III secretion system chaperone n=1 Tax=Rhizobium alvei TaxID=1132659 RepID=A0ABT8YSI5_9HYPH|nr:type III secretion system chaperone [Rhizobium alvei]MDO6966465.1 type III secretion system chaperone [Rhizobium alvei]